MAKGKEQSETVAIIGMACRLPGANHYSRYWSNLKEGKSSISSIPADRWDTGYSQMPHWAGLLDDIWAFDNYFFKTTPKEAIQIDPQQRILLEEVKHCIDDSGLSLDMLRKHKTSVFVGVMASDFLVKGISDHFPVDQYSALGNYHSILANRVSYAFGLTGESIAIDAACASSLVAMHNARMHLLSGQSEFAIVAGVNIICAPWKHQSFAKAGMLSPEGQCKTFDYTADGYVPGEGVGVVLLATKAFAQKNDLDIYGLVDGSAANHTGTGRTITAPSVRAQAEVVAEAIKRSGISPDDISYVEAHGTGTSLGDPIEVEALKCVFGKSANPNRYIGSVKTNIGHLEAAAGIAGVIKVCMMFRHREMPPSLNVHRNNPIINFDDSFLKPCSALLPWQPGVCPLNAGVSSFGFGGANAHVVLSASMRSKRADVPPVNRRQQVFCLSAHSEQSLKSLLQGWGRYADTIADDSLSDVCYTLACNRMQEKFRFGCVVGSVQELKERLADSDKCDVGENKQLVLLLNELDPGTDFKAIAKDLGVVSPNFNTFYTNTISQVAGLVSKQGLKAAEAQRLDHFRLLLALAKTIISTSAEVAVVSGSGVGFLAAANLAGLMTFEQCVSAIIKGVDKVSLDLQKAKLPFWMASTNTLVKPFNTLGVYWENLMTKALPEPAVADIYIEKAKLLYGQQGTFTNAINRWFSIVETFGRNLKPILSEAVAYQQLSKSDLLCLLIGIRLGLDEINNRWSLTYSFEDDSSLPELVNYLNTSVLDFGELLEFIIHSKGKRVIEDRISDHWRKIQPADHPLLYKTLANDMRERAGTVIIPKNAVHTCVGLNDDNIISLVVAPGEDIGLTKHKKQYSPGGRHGDFLEIMLWLWRHGVSMLWDSIAGSGGRPVQGLPAYVFDKHRYCHESLTNITYAGGASSSILNGAESISGLLKNGNGAAAQTNGVIHSPQKPEGNGSSDNATHLRSSFIHLLASIVEDNTGIPAGRIKELTSFSELGLDSSIILRLNKTLSDIFGALPVTLFFQYRDIGGLADYFIKNYPDKLADKFPFVNAGPARNDAIPDTNGTVVHAPAAKAKTRTGRREDNNDEDIAIIGISGRYPGAENIEELWALLKSGGDSIEEIPRSRWNYEKYTDSQQPAGTANAKWGGFLKNIDQFDPAAFGISPREARFMSPQERLFLEEAYSCFDNAGYLVKLKTAQADNNIGVFVGASYNDYQLYSQEQQYTNEWVPTNAQSYSVANKVSYHFDLHGPSIVVDTACSSSLYAIHLACQSIRSGESSVALAGGVNTSLHPSKYQMLSAYHFLSSDGKCRAFGDDGDGYVPSEGVGAILLKPLSKAVEDNDCIYGIIKSIAVSHGGKTHGYSVPNPQEQARAITSAIEQSGINPQTITYVEAHGTGTSLGDPIEISGLTQAYQLFTDSKQFCAIGSIKSNIGHAEAAAGIAQVTKVIMQMKTGMLVPSLLHSHRLNPNIPFAETPFYVQRKLSEWTVRDIPRRSGISSFGAGGVNVHMIIEEYKGDPQRETRKHNNAEEACMVALSADSIDQLIKQADNISGYIKRHLNGEIFLDSLNIQQVAGTLLNYREVKPIRAAFGSATLEEVVVKLDKIKSVADTKAWIQHAIYFSGTEGLQWFQRNLNNEDKVFVDALIKTGSVSSFAKLWVLGAPVDWLSLCPHLNRPPVYLPPYEFQKQYIWYPNVPVGQPQVSNGKAVASFTVKDIPEHTVLEMPGWDSVTDDEETFLDELADNPESVRSNMVKEQLKNSLAILLGHSSGKAIKGDVGFFDMGVDSIQLTSLQVTIKATYGIDLPETAFFEYPTVNKLSERILANLDFNRRVKKKKERRVVTTEVENDRRSIANAPSKVDDYSVEEIEGLDIAALEQLLEHETKGF
jgi:acyl transferase domain-containing protein